MPDYRNNSGTGIVKADGFQTNGVTTPKVVLSGTITFNPPSLTTGAFAVSNAIAITGIALGDAIELFAPYDTQGIMHQATPSSAGNMKIALTSCAAGTVDLAEGTWGYVVKRRA
jgi:hypothetical protein